MPPAVSRRSLLIGTAAAAVVPGAATPAQAGPRARYAYVGSRTTKARNARGTGITMWRIATPGGPDPDTVGVLRVDPGTGTLQPVDWVSTHGIRPRFFGLDPAGRRLYAANEVTDTIAGFTVDGGGGRLHSQGIAARTGSPVCIVLRP